MSCVAENASNMQTGLPTLTQTIRYMTVAEAYEDQNHNDIKLSPPLPNTKAHKKTSNPTSLL